MDKSIKKNTAQLRTGVKRVMDDLVGEISRSRLLAQAKMALRSSVSCCSRMLISTLKSKIFVSSANVVVLLFKVGNSAT